MSDPFHPADPVENWLGTDIELLSPPSGAFERIQRRAKRRKTVVALGTAAGAAVAIAAAATLPQLASSLLPNHGNVPAKFPSTSTSSNSPRPSHTPSGTPKSHRSSCSAKPAQPNLYIGGSTKPPTPGISPSSVTFVNGTVGAVIGETASGCEAVAATTNYGRSWTKVDAPPSAAPSGSSGVSQIRFLEATNGWAYGPDLYSTHDGGQTWNKIRGLPGKVIDLATVGGSAFAVVASCTGTGADYATGCTSFRLYWSPYDLDNWQPVAGASGRYPVVPGGLQLTSLNGYLLAGPTLLTGSPSGGAWHRVAITSTTVPTCLTGHGDKAAPGESGVIAPGAAAEVYLLCQSAGGGGSLYASTDSGTTWQLDGHVKAQGTAMSLAIAPGSGTLVLATSAGIYYSTDASHWHGASLSGQAPAAGFGFVGMTMQNEGVAVPAGPGSTVIYITTDGGRHWTPKRIA